MTEFELKSVCKPMSTESINNRLDTDIISIFCRFNTMGGTNSVEFDKAARPVLARLCNDMIREGRIRALCALEEAKKECGQHD